MERRERTAALTTAAFLALAAIYFIPGTALGKLLPAAAVKYRIIGPLAVLTLAGAALLPWQMTLAMAFSLAGDFSGAYGSFLFQMGFFALAHVMLIIYFSCRLRQNVMTGAGPGKAWSAAAVFIAAGLAAFALSAIIPHAPAGAIRTGCSIYALLICSMFCLSMLTRHPVTAAGAALFLFSDTVLSWNKFVSPVEYSRWMIMVPYYSGQLLIWLGAVSYEARLRTSSKQ